ncbi:helix-turn-helix domain-containing protein [Secundilactobacillus folii]|uniref:Helix-turn-helix domain-containing protein n=1 Tax=Secundilactobacillus folii TaxID=2678357 RepID=A0A7X2XTK4_9LACO|nr:helix-turn-helix domain-containing protein [Secundilactobacillus folii]MTV81394.1 helix-turn-helix domain-containing protein [Secundilactobacillus folii]
MQESLGTRLRSARINSGLSQNDAATIMHISRQSFSKWENDRGYPDIDNLVYLSQLYEVSIDNLLKDNDEMKEKISVNEAAIKDKRGKLKKVNKTLFQNSDEGLFLIILALVSAIIPPIGIVMPLYVMWRNSKYNSLYKTIYLISIVIIMVSILGTSIYVSDNWLSPTETHVYRTN